MNTKFLYRSGQKECHTMKSESAELVSGLIRQYRRLRLLYLGYLAAAVLALVFF